MAEYFKGKLGSKCWEVVIYLCPNKISTRNIAIVVTGVEGNMHDYDSGETSNPFDGAILDQATRWGDPQVK